jgi:hypothetical protein
MDETFSVRYVPLQLKQAEVIENYENEHVRSIGHDKAKHRKYQRLNLAAVKLMTGKETKLQF